MSKLLLNLIPIDMLTLWNNKITCISYVKDQHKVVHKYYTMEYKNGLSGFQKSLSIKNSNV